EVLGLFGFKPGSAKYFSFNELFEADKRRALEQKMRNALMPENERLLNQRQNILNEFNAFAQENPDATEKENNATFELLRSRYQEAEDEIEEFHELIQLEKTRWMFANQRFHTSKAAAKVAWDDVQAARDARLEKMTPGYLEAKKEFDAITARVMNIQRTARAIHVGEDLNENDRLDPEEDLNRNGELDKGPNPKKLTPFQRNLGKFASAFSLYRQLKNSLYPQEMSDLFGPAYEYETSVYNLAKNLQDHGVSKGFPDALNTLARLPDYMMESMPPEAQDAIGNFSLAAQYLKSASPLGIIPPASFAGKITILNDSRTLSASEGNLTAFLEPQDQVKIGSFSTFRGIWRENQLREKLIQSVDKPDSLTLTNPHQGRSPLVDAAAYLLIVSVAFGIFRGLRRKRKPQIAIGAGAMVFALLSCLWIILFGTPSATIEDATLHHIDWTTLPESILDSRGQGEKPDPDKMGEINPYAQGYAELALAYQMNNSTKFNEIVGKLDQDFAAVAPSQWHDFKNIRPEQLFNGAQPFVNCMALYLVSLILVFLSWLFWPEPLRKSAFGIAAVALILHSIALIARIWIQGRPPVTNLYSSAIFISWGAVCFGLIFERIHRNGIGSAAAGIVGFVSLVIAHGLAMDGDTMEMLQAVLDTNLWLATHVVCITFGYVAMFVAGILGIIYVVRGILDRNFDKAAARSIGSMIYGVTCFAVLFSFVGTMLGGIWADQSWGRFWGWDPKENGAILIVIWSAILLHARWGGIAKTR
ncbi:MAG: cytochrome c biogenesis protein CcsA, partial [Opitutales bacterium]